MKTKAQIIKYLREQINNLHYCIVDIDNDNIYSKELKAIAIDNYKKQIKELEIICKKLEGLLI